MINPDENYIVPDDFFNIKLYNKISLIIIDALNYAFIECDKLLEREGYNKHQNLVAIFYHHLTNILCSYLFSKYEIDLCNIKKKEDLSKIMFIDKIPSPCFIDYDSIFENQYQTIDFYKKDQKRNAIRIIRSLIRWVYHELNNTLVKVINPSAPHVLFGRNGSIGTKVVKKNGWQKRSFCFKTDSKPLKVFIPQYNDQYNILLQSIQNTVQNLNEIWPTKFKISNKLLRYIYKEIQAHLADHEPEPESLDADILVTGCIAELHSRKLAATAKLLNIPVIAIWHGDSIGTIDEPIFGAGEQTFSDAILGYGDYGCNELQKGQYNQGLFGNPTVISGSSGKVKDLYQGKDVKQLSNLSDSIVMYIPTLFRGSGRYGPFMTFHDLGYLSWQKEMLRHVMDIMRPERLIRKAHRKEKFNYTLKLPGIENIKEPDLLDVLDNADILIYDRPTTAFTLGAATNKPIIYFDIGIRNFSPEALKSIKKRCIYIKGDPKNAESLVKKAFQDRKKKCINTFTKRYSLSQDSRSREEILIDWINNYTTVHR